MELMLTMHLFPSREHVPREAHVHMHWHMSTTGTDPCIVLA